MDSQPGPIPSVPAVLNPGLLVLAKLWMGLHKSSMLQVLGNCKKDYAEGLLQTGTPKTILASLYSSVESISRGLHDASKNRMPCEDVDLTQLSVGFPSLQPGI